MAKSNLEKAIEKQQKEAKRMADQEARRQRASSIVNGQPQIGGMRIMDQAAEEVFKAVLSCYDGNENRYVHSNYDVIPDAHKNSLLLEFEKLTMYGVITSPRIWISAMWEATLTPQGLTYFEDKKAAQEKEEKIQKQKGAINIGSITANGGNVFLGDVTSSSFSIDNSISDIAQEISEKGGNDVEELKAILDEVKELIENIDDSRHIPKNKGLFQRITRHLDKHGWFYAEIVGLLGTAAMTLLQG